MQQLPESLKVSTVPSARYVWYVVGLLSLVNLFNYMDRIALAVLAPAIQADLHLTDGQLGLLVGFAFFLFYAVCGIPVARWADRGNRRNLITTTLSIWSVMTALCGAVQNFGQLLAARAALGVGEAGCMPAGASLIADYVPLRRRPGAYAISVLGSSLGTMAGLILAGVLGEMIGWRGTFVVLGLPGLALALLVRLTLREPVRGASDGVKAEGARLSLRETIAVLGRCRTYRRLVLFFVLTAFSSHGLTTWLPSFYVRMFGISLSSMGLYLGLAIGVGLGFGMIVGGILANKAAQREVRRPLQIGAAAIALMPLAILTALFVPSWSASMLFVLIAHVLGGIPAGAANAALISVTQPRMRATASALLTFCMSVLGFGLGPLCVGVLTDLLAPVWGVESLRYALLLPMCGLVGVMAALYAAAKTLSGDLRAVGARVEEPDA